MNIFGKPKNIWGKIRLTCVTGFAVSGILIVFHLIRSLSIIDYAFLRSFSLLELFEFILLFFVGALLSGWMEQKEIRKNASLVELHAKEKMQQDILLDQFRNQIQEIAASFEKNTANITDFNNTTVVNLIRKILPDLNAKTKGMVLSVLYDYKLICDENPAVGFEGISWSGTDITENHLDGINISNVDFQKSCLIGANLERSCFSGCDLRRSVFRNANLKGSNLREANLQNANFSDANLEGTDLRDANLTDTFFKGANLRNCFFGTSSLDCTDFSEVLESAILISTILPDGRKITNEKGKQYLRRKEYEMIVDKL